MILQDNDPHHLHPDPSYFYLYLVLAPILIAAVFYVCWKLMNYLDNRKTEKPPDNKDSESLSEREERLK